MVLTVRGLDLGASSGSICMNMGSARFACSPPVLRSALLSHTMYQPNGFSQVKSPKNYQFNSLTRNSKELVNDFVGELNLEKPSINTLSEINSED